MRFSLKRNKKGVSPIIATLLLIVIAVAAAVVTYAFVTGFIGTATSQSNQQGAMSIDTGAVSTTNITIYVRNTGTKSETLNTVYVDNVLMTGAQITAPTTYGLNNPLLPGNTTTVTIFTATNYANGVAHTVKVMAADGTPVAYSVHS